MKFSVFGTLVSAACVVMFTAQVHAQTEIREDFSFAKRNPGDLLDGTNAGGSAFSWRAKPTIVVQGESADGYLSFENEGFGVAQIDLPSTSSMLIIEAQVRSIDAADKKGWLAVGFGAPADPEITWPVVWGRGVSVILHGDGQCEVIISPTEKGDPGSMVRLKGGEPGNIRPDEVNTIRIEYNVTDSSLNVAINGKQWLANEKLSNRGFTPEFAAAGISGYNQLLKQPSVEEFVLTID